MAQFYPFFAAYNVSRVSNMRVVPGRVQKSVPLMNEGYFEDPSVRWEQRIDNGYPNVFYDESAGEYRCYYTCFLRDDASVEKRPEARTHERYGFHHSCRYRPRVAGILLMTSKDGIRWERPNLGVCEYEGSDQNNILMTNVHGASVFYDVHEQDPAKRYKMVVRHDAHRKMAVSFSADGIHFCPPIDWSGDSPAGDTHNFAFWDERIGKYILITRTWADGALRLSALCESEDFLNWTKPVEIYRGDGLDDQIYSMPVFRWGELYLGLGSIFHGGDSASRDFDCVDCELLYSTDLLHWNRVCKGQPLIPRAMGRYGDGVPDAGCVYASAPVLEDGRYRIYYFGSNGQHTNFRESALVLSTTDPDALAGYAPKDAGGGMLVTCPVSFTGDALYLKAELAPNARLAACVSELFSIHESAEPIEGFDYEDAAFESVGENLWRVRFAAPLGALANSGCCICLRAENAVLYGFGGDLVPVRRTI